MIVTIEENDEGKRIDTYLKDMYDIPRTKIQTAIKNKQVKVNDKFIKPAYKLKENDLLDFTISDTEDTEIQPEDIALDIRYEDENMLVVNKPSGMLTHPTTIEKTNTLVNALLYKYKDNLSDINGKFRRGIVHRLDRNTSGLLMVAKNNKTHEYLANLIKNHEITKKYRAILKGKYPLDDDVIDLPIGRNTNQPQKMMVTSDGKRSITKLKVLKRFKDATYVELTLITGRTHQIRVHTSFKGYPVFNDTLYGAGMAKIKTEEQVLQSFYLKFTKPFKDDTIEIQIEPDEKIKKVLKYFELRN
ncbi:MAG: RluA family pseudouridine synthase [Clostridiaceae bacterium]|jgi:23S rRNA pseudouridine1911/1915/1917 synthase|nr:RluA family pseudouridine synthase [Clostridiaceae bacterium]